MNNDINVLDILALDDNNKYVVSAMTELNGIIYLLIGDIKNKENIKFVEKYYRNNELRLHVVEDHNLIKELALLFAKSGIDTLEQVKNDLNA